ncbi:hypothetical protein [Marinicella sp. W31]|uniref:hypothetical protein n=1 Tax=Marinicella sp. W31 TaxID=3023713 RepID=UPI0037578475
MKKIICLLCLSSAIAQADTTLRYTSNGDTVHSVIQLIDDKVHMISQGEGKISMLFDAKSSTFTTLMHDEKKYMSFGPKEIEAIGDIASIMEAEMEKQLAQMPASQREQMRDMMMGMLKQQMPKQTPKPNYSKTGMEKSYNGFSCEIVVKKVEEQTSGNFCVSEYADLGISSSEYNAISSLMEVAEKMASQFGHDNSMNFSSIGKFVPVQFSANDETGTLQSVSHDPIDPSVFMIPEDYSKEEIDIPGLQ